MGDRALKKFRLQAMICLLALSSVSCAYKLRRGSLSRGVADVENARVFVPVVDNTTTEVGPEAVLTSSVREALSTLPGIEVVNRENEARFVLRGRIKEWGRNFATSSGASTAEQEALGGLIEKQTTVADIRVYMGADFELIEVVSPDSSALATPVARRVWKRLFSSEAKFGALNRYDEASGSSSAPHVNRSRERLQLKRISENIARQIIDQVSQDF